MSITVECKRCGKGYRLPEDKGGLKMKCRECDSVIEIPQLDFIADDDIEELDDLAPVQAVGVASTPNTAPAATGWRSKKVQYTGAIAVVLVAAGVVLAILFGRGILGGQVAEKKKNDEEGDIKANNKYASRATELGIEETALVTDVDNNVKLRYTFTVTRENGDPVATKAASVGPASSYRGFLINRAMEAGSLSRRVTRPPARMVGAKDFDAVIATRDKLRKIVLAMWQYQRKWGAFPSAYKRGQPLSWRVHILPFLGYEDLHGEFKLNEAWDSPHNKKLIAKMPDVFKTKEVKGTGKTALHVFVGLGTPFGAAPGETARFELRVQYAARGTIKPNQKYRFKLEFTSDTNSSDIPPAMTRDVFGRDLIGKTSYSWKFDRKQKPVKGKPTRFRDITDSSATTLCTVLAGPETAAEWTKPGGLLLDPFTDKVELGTLPSTGMPAIFFTGMFATIPRDIDRRQLIAMIQHASGDVVLPPLGANMKYKDKSPAYIKNEEVAEQSAILQRKLIAALNSVQDASTAKQAASKIEQIADSAKRLSESKLPLMSAAEKRILAFQFDSSSLSHAVERNTVGPRALLRSGNEPTLKKALEYIKKTVEEMQNKKDKPII